MSALSSLANVPQLVLQIFRDLKVKKNGCYEVILNIDGEWQIVLVDDWIPCTKSSSTPIPLFARPSGKELWVILLEKAYAKINGGYLNIVGGIPSDVMATTTNFPSEYVDHEEVKKDEFWTRILKSSENSYLMNSASNHDGLRLLLAGLVSGHAYSLIKAKEGIVNGELIRLVKMRNPWGKTEWKGKWSDKSKLWTDEAKKVFQEEIVVENDGIFWMGYDEYMQMFYSTQFCMVISPSFTKTVTIAKEKAQVPHLIEICLHDKIEIAINGIKPHWRFNRKLPKEAYLQLNMILIKKNTKITEDNLETYFTFVAGNQNISPFIKMVLEPGTYLLYTQADYEGAIKLEGFDDVYPYRVQIGASEFIDVNYKGEDIEYNIARLALINYIKTTKKEELTKKPIVYLHGSEIATMSYGYYFVYNNSKEDYNFTLKNSCENMDPLFPNHNEKPICLAPGNSFISFGPKRKFDETAVCYFTLNAVKEKGSDKFCLFNSSFVQDMHSNIKLTENLKEFTSGFIFKKIDIDFNKFFTVLDVVEEAIGFYTSKYPDLMKLLIPLEKQKDGVKVKFTDKYIFDDGSWSFGETKVENPKIRHGRTIYQWAKQDVKYVGYAKEGNLHGEATIYYGETKSKRVLFENGKFKSLL